jgi:hypothetical protein
MSLRPRYSLLTLLVLTALVAGGVKLWYGPHRVVIKLPLSQADAEFLSQFVGHVEAEESGRGGFLELESIRDGWESRVLSIKGVLPPNEPPLYLYTFTHADEQLNDGLVTTASSLDRAPGDSPEHINRRLHRIVATYFAGTELPPKTINIYAAGRFNTLYYVTETKTVYSGMRVNFDRTHFHPTDIKAIQDPYLRARIQEDLAKLKK